MIVCRTVQREIDNQKNLRNDRVSRRARTTSSMFGLIIDGGEEYILVRESNPIVKLYLEGPGLPSPELKDRLDYSKPDDELVGHLHRFVAANPGRDVRLLTHDRGPRQTARFLDLPYVAIKENWLLRPEPNEMERENARLQERVAQLESAEPKFRIELVDDKVGKLKCLKVEFSVFEPLSEEDLEDLVQQLSNHFPMENNFGPLEVREEEEPDGALGMIGARRVCTPASSDAISKYTDIDYPAWIDDCESVLLNLHKVLQFEAGQPTFTIAAYNEGTRPGASALVEITACGNFWICPPPDPEDDDETEQPKRPVLDPPPHSTQRSAEPNQPSSTTSQQVI